MRTRCTRAQCSVVALALLMHTVFAAAPRVRAMSAHTWSQRQGVLQRLARAATAAWRAPPPPSNRTPSGRFDRTYDDDRTAFPAEVVVRPRPDRFVPTSALPVAWDWRAVALGPAVGLPLVDFTTRVRNQFLPLWCGSCWAHAATAVLGSRWRIHAAENRSTDFSVQYFVNCVAISRGCNGGSSYEAFAHAHRSGAVDSSCLPYVATTQTCSAAHTCEQHMNLSAPSAHAVPPRRYPVAEYGFTKQGEASIMKEIYARGPVAHCMASHVDSFHAYNGGIYTTTSNRSVCDHVVAIVGFGGTGASAYWVVQNSFGTVWGEGGYFRIKRSSALQGNEHNLGIDAGEAAWAMPPTEA